MWIRLIGTPDEVSHGLARLRLIYPDGDYGRRITSARQQGHVRAYVEITEANPPDNREGLPALPPGDPGTAIGTHSQ